eukprot:4049422-Pleurochrysis_carterae.AAC.1
MCALGPFPQYVDTRRQYPPSLRGKLRTARVYPFLLDHLFPRSRSDRIRQCHPRDASVERTTSTGLHFRFNRRVECAVGRHIRNPPRLFVRPRLRQAVSRRHLRRAV